jgi:hypothetical protein
MRGETQREKCVPAETHEKARKFRGRGWDSKGRSAALAAFCWRGTGNELCETLLSSASAESRKMTLLGAGAQRGNRTPRNVFTLPENKICHPELYFHKQHVRETCSQLLFILVMVKHHDIISLAILFLSNFPNEEFHQ